ncbi:gata transcription factor [Grosmannia clavigera kw1407]|uniref:Gata transcription factor n=1 Tax=Grosmannia clavigera (strain kw1407 / UAMH 11150) TaxID=655863 RepID=F0XU66_GROCL|nr:gata transcription factor [Grosmannia clavigera kw1407]EFW98555.1 gata transcription factor [Grosmannia clavigera kw1407]
MSEGQPPAMPAAAATDLYGFGGAVDRANQMVDGDATPRPNAAFTGSQDEAMMLLFDDPSSFFGGFFEDFQQAPASPTAATDTMPTTISLHMLPPTAFDNDNDGSSPTTAESNGSGSSTLLVRPAVSAIEGPGAGPQPATEFEQQGPAASGSALAEFTRRKNWPAKIVEELRDLLMVIDPNGRIRYVTARLPELLGYSHTEAVGQMLTDLVHVDDRFVFMSELNACIANAALLRLYCRIRRRDGSYAVVETVGHAHIAESRFAPNPANQSAFCQAVFLMLRPYPTKNASLLDSFLEHKMENERLRRRIDDIRHEEASEDHDIHMHSHGHNHNHGNHDSHDHRDGHSRAHSLSSLWRHSIGSRSDLATSDAGAGVLSMQMAPPPHPMSMGTSTSLNNAALTRENLEGIAARRPDSLRDKMERYKGVTATAAPSNGSTAAPGGSGEKTARQAGPMGTATHADTIEMLTGLRYQEGERSKGLSTGNRSPQLVKGDVGIAFSLNRDQRAGEKKKKMRLAEEYVCTDCGTLESPEWRKGPNGPKTLCNACGLRWAKKEKKEKKREQLAETAVGPQSPTRNRE